MSAKAVTLGKSAFPEKAGARTPTALLEAKSMSQYTPTEDSSDATCPTCGDVFDSEYGVSAHHWQAHGEKLRVELECDNCGSEIKKRKCEVYDTNFCDEGCMYEYQAGDTHPNAAHETRECEMCGESVTRCEAHYNEHVFCSRDCYADWVSENYAGAGHPVANGEIKSCVECGEEIYRGDYLLDGREHFCSPGCREASKKRDSAPATLVTAVRRQLSASSWGVVADQYRSQRDGDCEMCGASVSKYGQKHDVHHIVPVVAGGANEPELLMELCRGCHANVEKYTRELPGMKPVLTE
jgi:hypothetical protein